MTLGITFYDGIKYHRSDFINRDADIIGNGVVALTDFPVTFPATPNMNVNIGQGRAWVDGYRVTNDSSVVTLTVPTADATNPRIDIIQIGHDDINSLPSLVVKKGVAAASPVEPGADPGYVKLWAINVAANVASITSGNMTDRRALMPLNVSGTQINMAGAAGTGQDNTFAAGHTQTFNGPAVFNGAVTIGGQTPITSLPADLAKIDTAQTWTAIQTWSSAAGGDTSFGIENYNAALGASWNNQNLGGNQFQINGAQEATDVMHASTNASSALTSLQRQWYSYALAASVFSADFITGAVKGKVNVFDDGSGNATVTTLNGIKFTKSSSAPANPSVGDQWFDLTVNRWKECTVGGATPTWVDPIKLQ